MEEEEEDEELQDLFDWIDSQPLSDEDIQRILQLSKRGGLTEEEREWCRRCCRGDKS